MKDTYVNLGHDNIAADAMQHADDEQGFRDDSYIAAAHINTPSTYRTPRPHEPAGYYRRQPASETSRATYFTLPASSAAISSRAMRN